MTEIKLQIDGMHCGACVRRVTQALASAPGIEVKEVRIGGARVSTAQHESAIQPAIEALERAGYRSRVEP